MFVSNRLKLLLLIFINVIKSAYSEDFSDFIYSTPFTIFEYPSSKQVYTYLYIPKDDRYEVVNYYKSPVQYKTQVDVKKKSAPIIVENNKRKSHDEAVSTLSEGGQKYEKSFHKKQGHKSKEGYSSDHKYEKGKKDSYKKEHKSGDEKIEKMDKASNHDDHKDMKEDKNSVKNEKGEKYNAKKHHKKGSHKKGYHNVFMKDEYKKDHIFFDNSDEKGHYSKHGSEHKKYHNNESESIKGAHKNSDQESKHNKKESLKQKKKYDDADEEFKKKFKKESFDSGETHSSYKNGVANYNVAIKHAV